MNRPGFAGRQCESVTVDRMPGRQIIVYDKWRDSKDKLKLYWFEAWGLDPNGPRQDVYRIEMRAGKKHLKDRWGLSTFADIEASIGDVIKHAFEDVRYHADFQTDTNVTRQLLHPIWEEGSRIALHALHEHRAGLLPERIKELERERYQELILRQIGGLLASWSAVLGFSDEEINEHAPRHLAAPLDNRMDDQFMRNVARARRRLKFII